MPGNDSPNFLTCPAVPELPPPEQKPEPVVVQKPEPPKPVAPPKPKKRRSWVFWVVMAVVVAVVAATAPAIVSLSKAALAANAARASVKAAQEKMKVLDITGAHDDLAAALVSVNEARADLRGVGFWRDVPVVGTHIRALEDAASAAAGTLDSAGDILDVASVVVDSLRGGSGAFQTGIAPTRRFADLSREEKRNLLQKLDDELPQLRIARDKMDLAMELWSRVPQNELVSPIQAALKPLADSIPVLQKSLDEVVPLMEVVSHMSGYPQPRRYLVALQNSDELRPGGGFIGNIGTMTMDTGDLTEFAFTDVYSVDGPVSGVWKDVPPTPIAKYLGLNQWFLRDANWSSDFPTSAEKILDDYIREVELSSHAQMPLRPDTYIAFEPGFFKSLLHLTGPIAMDGDTYDENNFFDRIEYNVEIGFQQRGVPLGQRKAIIGKLGNEIVKRVFALPSSEWPKVLDIVTAALDRKQIMVYSRDQDFLRTLDDRGWTARTKATDGDFLQVVDANLGALKTDGMMSKSVTYTVDMTDPQGPKATVTLKYHNNTQASDWRYTRYRTYTRVYVPEGSTLISSRGAMENDLNVTGRFVPGRVDVTKELGKTVFGAFWAIEPRQNGELSFTYRLPQPVADRLAEPGYHLDIQKQPGADATNLTLDLLFGKNIQSASPSEDPSKWGDARYEYETDTLTDHAFTIRF